MKRARFIATLMPAAIEASKRTGVDPRIIIAQAAQETGWGEHAPNNNYFGIKSHGKSGGQTFGTTEVVNGKRVREQASFRGYGGPDESVAGYADFLLENPRYTKFRSANGLDEQAAALQASGYATDPNYGSTVLDIARGIEMDGSYAPSSLPSVDSRGLPLPGSQQNPSVDLYNRPLGTPNPNADSPSEGGSRFGGTGLGTPALLVAAAKPAQDKYQKAASGALKGLANLKAPVLGAGGNAPQLPFTTPMPTEAMPIVAGGGAAGGGRNDLAMLMARLNSQTLWG